MIRFVPLGGNQLKETLDIEYDLMGYADGYDFVCLLKGYQERILKHAPAILYKWSLKTDIQKTEKTTLFKKYEA